MGRAALGVRQSLTGQELGRNLGAMALFTTPFLLMGGGSEPAEDDPYSTLADMEKNGRTPNFKTSSRTSFRAPPNIYGRF